MIKVYIPDYTTGEYKDYSIEEARKILSEAKKDSRIIFSIKFNQRILDLDSLIDDDIIKVFPIVGGG